MIISYFIRVTNWKCECPHLKKQNAEPVSIESFECEAASVKLGNSLLASVKALYLGRVCIMAAFSKHSQRSLYHLRETWKHRIENSNKKLLTWSATKEIIFLHDNVRPHVATLCKIFLHIFRWEVVECVCVAPHFSVLIVNEHLRKALRSSGINGYFLTCFSIHFCS